MADIYKNIRVALETTLSGVVGIPPINYENVAFDPDPNSSHVSCILSHTTRRPSVRGLNPQQRYDGFLFLGVYVPKNQGPDPALSIASSIITDFESTTDITYSGTVVSIEYIEIQEGFEDGAWYYLPVQIKWYTYD